MPTPLRERFNLSRLALAHPRWTVGIWCTIGALGLLAARRMPIALFPDIEFPVIAVDVEVPRSSTSPAAGAPGLLRDVTYPLERRLLPLGDRGAITSTSTATAASVVVPFDVGIRLDVAEQRVRKALAGLPLPASAHLGIHRIDLNESPIMTLATASGAGPVNLDRLVVRLEQIPGVARVVQLGATTQGSAGAQTRVRLNGMPAVALQVIKHSGANTLAVTRALDRVLTEADTLGTRHFSVLRPAAPYVREAAQATLEALWVAALLAVVVIYLFLRSLAATLIAALAIPMSLLGAFLVMAWSGFIFETITLLALALIMGIIVDDAIVDLENIVRHLPFCSDPLQAAQVATDEIGLTVTAATLTIVAVFLPVGLMGGVVGNFFRPFGLTIAAAVFMSLMVARTLTPILAAQWLKANPVSRPSPRWLQFASAYRALLAWSLAHPWRVLLAAATSLLAGVLLIPLIPQGFIPTLDRGECDIHFALPADAQLASSDQLAAQLTAVVRRDPDVAQVLSLAGNDFEDAGTGVLQVTLRAQRRSVTHVVAARLRAALRGFSAAHISVDNIPIIAVAAPQPLAITLTSADEVALRDAGTRALQLVNQWRGVADASMDGMGSSQGGTWLHHEGRPALVIHGNLTGTVPLGEITERAEAQLPHLLPTAVRLELGGESAQAADVLGQFAPALGFAVVGVMAVLWLLFRSWQDPLAIATSLPLALVGAMLGLFIARGDFGIVSLLGLVFLVGLISKNAIILVDRINQLRAAGLSADAAILEAGPMRLRPITMTTAAAILGMLPVAAGIGAGAELRAPMAIAIIGGLLTSGILSLIVVPIVYRFLDRTRPRSGIGAGGKT